jgi:hypothetical protein
MPLPPVWLIEWTKYNGMVSGIVLGILNLLKALGVLKGIRDRQLGKVPSEPFFVDRLPI